MRFIYKLLIILLLAITVLFKIRHFYFTTLQQPKTNEENQITVSVYYEALCPDSRRFILEQLLPAYELIPEAINLDLVPYGKANTREINEVFSFSCQHGPTECIANKIHACAIKYTEQNPLVQLKYIACMINDNYNPENAGKKCASEFKIEYSPIENCSVSNMGTLLLKDYGDRTKRVKPRISFIPTVEFDGKHSKPQEEVLSNFFSEVCKSLIIKPAECF